MRRSAQYFSGLLRVFAGQPDLALEHFETYLGLSPRDRGTTYLNGIGDAHFFSRRFDEAAANLLASLDLAPTFAVTYRVLASCYAHMRPLDDAREIVRRLGHDHASRDGTCNPLSQPLTP